MGGLCASDHFLPRSELSLAFLHSVDSLVLRMKVLLAIIFLASSLYMSNAFTLPNFLSFFLDFDDQNKIDDSSQKWNQQNGFIDTQRQSRGGSHESFDPQGYPHHDNEAHHYAEHEPSDVKEQILPVFLIAFFASIVNSLFLFKSVPIPGTATTTLDKAAT